MTSIELQTIRTLRNQFQSIDKDHDGFLNTAELTFYDQGTNVQNVANLNRELMFANIDPEENAWYGLSRQDLYNLETRLGQGKNLNGIAAELRQQIGQ